MACCFAETEVPELAMILWLFPDAKCSLLERHCDEFNNRLPHAKALETLRILLNLSSLPFLDGAGSDTRIFLVGSD